MDLPYAVAETVHITGRFNPVRRDISDHILSPPAIRYNINVVSRDHDTGRRQNYWRKRRGTNIIFYVDHWKYLIRMTIVGLNEYDLTFFIIEWFKN